MEFSAEEQAIKEELDRYVAGQSFQYNSDHEIVWRVIRGLAKRQEKSGKAYCPCRMVTGNRDADEKIVCPCAYHVKEIAENGACYCRLFVAKRVVTGDGD